MIRSFANRQAALFDKRGCLTPLRAPVRAATDCRGLQQVHFSTIWGVTQKSETAKMCRVISG